jgi:anti-anti-sigma factor
VTVDIRSEVRNNIVWIEISGRMVLDGSLIRLREQVLFGLESGVRKFVIDISEVSHLDSSGCGEVISILTSISRAKGSLVFVNPNERVRLVWAHTKLDNVLNIFNTTDEAYAFIQSTPKASNTLPGATPP